MSLQILELAVRVLATAALVYAVSRTVAALGPYFGGLISGLPIVVGPGLFFLALDLPADDLATAAAATVLVLPATLVFMFAYAVAATALSPPLAAALALVSWLASALLLSLLPASAPTGFTLFVAAALLFRRLLADRRRCGGAPSAPRSTAILASRAILAGCLVGSVTVAAELAGPRIAGVLLSVPVAMLVIAVSVHQDHGGQAVLGTLRSALLGTVSIAAFGLVVALAAPVLGGLQAIAIACGASLWVTAMLIAAGALGGRNGRARDGGSVKRGLRGRRSRR